MIKESGLHYANSVELNGVGSRGSLLRVLNFGRLLAGFGVSMLRSQSDLTLMRDIRRNSSSIRASWRLLGHVAQLGVALLVVGFASGCPTRMENGRCVCPPGTGGLECQFSMQNLFFNETARVYDWRPRPLDLGPPWGVRPDLYQRLATNVSAQFIAEVGVWKGASTIAMAKYLKEQERGAIVAVDTFLGSLEMWDKRTGVGDPDFDLQIYRGYPSVFYTFLSNVIRSGVKEYVIPFPAPSKVASDYFLQKNLQFDLLHIDAGHDYEDVIQDIKLWWRNLRPGGIMMGDDWHNGWVGVEKAVLVFAAENMLKNEYDGGKWWFMKPKV